MKVIYDNWSVKPESHRFDKMCNLFYKVAELASISEEKCNLVVSTVNDLETMLSESFVNGKQSKISSIDGIRSSGKLDGTSAILTPLVVQSKGRPRFKRKQSKLEKVVQKMKGKIVQKNSNGKKMKKVSK